MGSKYYHMFMFSCFLCFWIHCTLLSPLHKKGLGTKLTSLTPYGSEPGYVYEANYLPGTVGNTLTHNPLWIPSLIGGHSKDKEEMYEIQANLTSYNINNEI